MEDGEYLKTGNYGASKSLTSNYGASGHLETNLKAGEHLETDFVAREHLRANLEASEPLKTPRAGIRVQKAEDVRIKPAGTTGARKIGGASRVVELSEPKRKKITEDVRIKPAGTTGA